jgi:hypothetical protein
MAEALFQVVTSVKPKAGGEAELVLPEALAGVARRFVAVKEGGEEAILTVNGSAAELKALAQDEHCRKLTPEQADTLRESYPAPKVKKKYRPRSAGAAPEGGQFETDDQGRIVDTIQTVRSGFYLIDVPIEAVD